MIQLKPARSASTALPPPITPERNPRLGAPRDGHEVAAELRRLVPLARRAIPREPGPIADPQPLTTVLDDVIELEAAVARLGLVGLLDYVAALRRRVESALPPPAENGRAGGSTNYPTTF